jgi:uncharacterized protein YjbI with pentapeptide repeats
MLKNLTQEELDQKTKQHQDYLEWLYLKNMYNLTETGQIEKFGFVDTSKSTPIFSDKQTQRLWYLDSQSPTFISLVGFDLSGCSLFGKNLKYANLCESKSPVNHPLELKQFNKFVDHESCVSLFRNVDFCNTNLTFAKMDYGCFDASYFSNSKLHNSIISHSSFVDANFCHANLDGAVCDMSNFRDADFRNVNFDGAYLRKSDFQGAKFDQQLIWARSIDDSKFSQTALPWLMLRPNWTEERGCVHICEE